MYTCSLLSPQKYSDPNFQSIYVICYKGLEHLVTLVFKMGPRVSQPWTHKENITERDSVTLNSAPG